MQPVPRKVVLAATGAQAATIAGSSVVLIALAGLALFLRRKREQ
ncbi:LPXTG cell wall anchor domain-containing protein [Corynebacterium hindlerae]